MIAVRPATRADMPALDALYARSYPRLLRADYPPSVLVLALPGLARVQPALVASGTYYVAEEEGAILGAGGWTPAGRGAPGRANVRHVVTDAAQVRRGVGRAVLGHVLATARAAGMTWMHCQSTRTAVPFYQAMGFTVLGPITVPLGPGIDFPAVAMRREL